MSEVIDEEWIFRYEDSRNQKTRDEHEANIKMVLDSLKPLIKENMDYLRYAQAKKWFEMTDQEREQASLHNALMEVIGRAIEFEVWQARKLAFEVLQDVNDHDNARKVAELLALELKSYEVE